MQLNLCEFVMWYGYCQPVRQASDLQRMHDDTKMLTNSTMPPNNLDEYCAQQLVFTRSMVEINTLNYSNLQSIS